MNGYISGSMQNNMLVFVYISRELSRDRILLGHLETVLIFLLVSF